MMGKRYWAAIIKQNMIAFAVVFGAGVLFDYLISNDYNRSPIMAGFVAVVIYVIAAILMTLLNAITGALYFWLFAGSDMVDGIVEEMHSSKLPPPRRSDPKTFDYLSMLADDEHAPANDRVRAAGYYATYNVMTSRGIFRALALRRALDNAVLRYSQQAPDR